MNLEDVIALRGGAPFNDIHFFDAPRPIDVGLIAHPVPSLQAFASHPSGSRYALWMGHVAWIDSEGEQYLLAESVDHFVDALHLPAGALFDVMHASQGSYGRPENRLAPLAELVEEYGPAWIAQSVASARKEFGAGYDAFVAWARDRGRGTPKDLPERLFTMRATARKLREMCRGK